MVVDEKLEELREATSDDVGGILQLIEPFEKDGTLVKRSRTEIERDIANYTIVEHDGVIFACAALYPYPEAKTAEMAAVTVSPQSQGQGDGEKILKRIEQRARAMGLISIFVLTTRTMHWFIKRGFVPADPRLVARSAQAQVQLGPQEPSAGQEAVNTGAGPWQKAQHPSSSPATRDAGQQQHGQYREATEADERPVGNRTTQNVQSMAVQSPLPLKIMGSARLSGKVSIMP